MREPVTTMVSSLAAFSGAVTWLAAAEDGAGDVCADAELVAANATQAAPANKVILSDVDACI